MMGLTPVQSNCLNFIRSEAEAGKPAPSYGEIAAHLGLKSRGRVCHIVKELEERGAVRRYPNRQRSIEVVDQGEVSLRPEIFRLVEVYARQERKLVGTIVNEAMAEWLGITS